MISEKLHRNTFASRPPSLVKLRTCWKRVLRRSGHPGLRPDNLYPLEHTRKRLCSCLVRTKMKLSPLPHRSVLLGARAVLELVLRLSCQRRSPGCKYNSEITMLLITGNSSCVHAEAWLHVGRMEGGHRPGRVKSGTSLFLWYSRPDQP
jgi:hypothetical protein